MMDSLEGSLVGAEVPGGDTEAAGVQARTFSLLVASVKDYAIFMLDPKGRIATWNSGAERIKGYSASEAIGRHFSIFYSEQEIAAGKCENELEIATREGRFEEEGWRLRKDGSRFWASVTITALRERDGRLVGFAKVTRDLTERKIAEDEAQRFQLLVSSVKDYAIFMLDPQGRIATWNSGAERIKGYSGSDAIGRHFSIFYPKEEVDSGKCEMELEIATREGRFEEEGWRLRKDGSRFWANVVITALRDHNDDLVGFAKVTRDLTERRAAEAERIRLAQAEEAERRNQEFLAIMGHELRNPLAPMVTALHRIRLRGARNCEPEIAVLGRQLAQMTRLVNDILDTSRFLRNDIRLQRAVVSIGDVLADAVDVAASTLEEKRHELKLDIAADELLVDGDRERLTQVFGNILSNAAKYTDRCGTISLSARAEGDCVVISIRDNGIGISSELLPQVFDLFAQAEQGLDRQQGGLGIGLAVAKRLVIVHGGTITAESAGRERGSCFTVKLPRVFRKQDAENSEQRTPLQPSAAGRRVLVVDDNEDSAEMMALFLRDLGHDVHVAFDGLTAVKMARELVPELVLLDIGLPELNGYEVAERIHRIESCAHVPLVAITGYAREVDHSRSRQAGFSLHLAKPVDVARLASIVDTLPARCEAATERSH
jgi:PAS domain S-box-containing protein